MDRATVIVAVPPVGDKIHKISSEAVPHLTLLYLGDVDLSEGAMLYVQHACEELSPFGLSVDYRGKLGEDEADVLFFENNAWDLKRVKEFRHWLLLNDEIKAAYDAADQYPEWTPHLTLGYPIAPAREIEGEDNHLGYLSFDRIAVWTGDFEGPEFRLKYDDHAMEVAMSDMSTAQRGEEAVKDVLEHYGVKGMHWGTRKMQVNRALRKDLGKGIGNSGGHDPSLSMRQRKKDDKWRHKANSTGVDWKKTAKYTDKKAVAAINNKPEYKDLDHSKSSPLKKKYDDEMNHEWAKAMTAYTASRNGKTNPSKTKMMKWTWNPKTKSYSATMVPVEHADSDIETIVEADENGFITGFLFKDNSLEQSESMEDALAHYGVKGMKWGVRKDEAASRGGASVGPTAVVVAQKKPGKFAKASGGKGHPLHEDAVTALAARQKAKASTTDALSNAELRKAVERMNLEKQYTQLQFESDRRSKGIRFVSGLFGQSRYNGEKRRYTDDFEQQGEHIRKQVKDMLREAKTESD